jgi:hypothetical protein
MENPAGLHMVGVVDMREPCAQVHPEQTAIDMLPGVFLIRRAGLRKIPIKDAHSGCLAKGRVLRHACAGILTRLHPGANRQDQKDYPTEGEGSQAANRRRPAMDKLNPRGPQPRYEPRQGAETPHPNLRCTGFSTRRACGSGYTPGSSPGSRTSCSAAVTHASSCTAASSMVARTARTEPVG